MSGENATGAGEKAPGATDAASADCSGFWRWFAGHQAELLDIMGGRRAGRVTELIDQALAAHHLDLVYEVTSSALGAELTFTPEGDPVLARFLDHFVALAPTFEGWVVFARVQRKPLTTALAFVRALHGLDLGDARFRFRIEDDRYLLCFLDDGLFALDEDRRFAVASTFLDHALGEELAMQHLGALEFQPAGEGVAMGLMINEIICDVAGPAAALEARAAS